MLKRLDKMWEALRQIRSNEEIVNLVERRDGGSGGRKEEGENG